jgi:hypothetical protein
MRLNHRCTVVGENRRMNLSRLSRLCTVVREQAAAVHDDSGGAADDDGGGDGARGT